MGMFSWIFSRVSSFLFGAGKKPISEPPSKPIPFPSIPDICWATKHQLLFWSYSLPVPSTSEEQDRYDFIVSRLHHNFKTPVPPRSSS